MATEMMKRCKFCEREFPIIHFKKGKSYKGGRSTRCRECESKYARERLHAKGLVTPYTQLRTCSSYLGVHVAERLLNNVFKTVQKMPMNNHGYDFICGRGKKVDSKCSTMKIEQGHCDRWRFDIERNVVADYFACIAFDNRNDLNPMHFWLIPGHKVNHLRCLCISKSTLDKWNPYNKSIDKILSCCNALKG
jgi:hypothetical protein